jgi:hypothetical protein
MTLTHKIVILLALLAAVAALCGSWKWTATPHARAVTPAISAEADGWSWD